MEDLYLNFKRLKIVFYMLIIVILSLLVVDNYKIYPINPKNILLKNESLLEENGYKNGELVEEKEYENTRIYSYKKDDEFIIITYSRSILYENYKLENHYILKNDDALTEIIESPKKSVVYDIEVKNNNIEVKKLHSIKNNGRYEGLITYFLILILILPIKNQFKKIKS